MATGHFMDGHTEDVTRGSAGRSQFSSLTRRAGNARVSAPGVYTINVASGTRSTGSAMLTATFTGTATATASIPAGRPRSTARHRPDQLAYPLDERSSRRT